MERRPVRPLAHLARRALHWAPVWVPALLLWQVTSRGLWPALEERDRLRKVGPEVRAMEEQHAAEYEEFSHRVEAQGDEIYRSRVERLERRRLQEQEEAVRRGGADAVDGESSADERPPADVRGD